MRLAAAVLALLLQILNPVWAAGMPMDEGPMDGGLSASIPAATGTFGDIPICHAETADVPVAGLRDQGDRGAHKHGLACAACHVCCHPQAPLPLGQIVLPKPRGPALRIASAVRISAPRGPPARGVWARGPPLFS